jgi:hypothetical protein
VEQLLPVGLVVARDLTCVVHKHRVDESCSCSARSSDRLRCKWAPSTAVSGDGVAIPPSHTHRRRTYLTPLKWDTSPLSVVINESKPRDIHATSAN